MGIKCSRCKEKLLHHQPADICWLGKILQPYFAMQKWIKYHLHRDSATNVACVLRQSWQFLCACCQQARRWLVSMFYQGKRRKAAEFACPKVDTASTHLFLHLLWTAKEGNSTACTVIADNTAGSSHAIRILQ